MAVAQALGAPRCTLVPGCSPFPTALTQNAPARTHVNTHSGKLYKVSTHVSRSHSSSTVRFFSLLPSPSRSTLGEQSSMSGARSPRAMHHPEAVVPPPQLDTASFFFLPSLSLCVVCGESASTLCSGASLVRPPSPSSLPCGSAPGCLWVRVRRCRRPACLSAAASSTLAAPLTLPFPPNVVYIYLCSLLSQPPRERLRACEGPCGLCFACEAGRFEKRGAVGARASEKVHKRATTDALMGVAVLVHTHTHAHPETPPSCTRPSLFSARKKKENVEPRSSSVFAWFLPFFWYLFS